ncbi:MAG: PAS domain S-box protein [Desulfobacula sp.]|nr:PAS domain S-box protein [Desulfobacula sp.]
MNEGNATQELINQIKFLEQQNDKLEKRLQVLEKSDKLQEYDKRYYAIYDQSPVGIATIDSFNGRFVEINRAYCDILGYSKSEILGMDFMQITHSEDLQEDLDNMERIRSGEIKSFRMKKRYIRKDGEIVWVSLTVVPLWSENTDPNFHIAIVNDITDSKRKEQALIKSEEKYQALVKNIPGTAYQFVLTTQNSFRFEYISENCINLFGYSAKEIIENPDLVFDHIPKPDAGVCQASCRLN